MTQSGRPCPAYARLRGDNAARPRTVGEWFAFGSRAQTVLLNGFLMPESLTARLGRLEPALGGRWSPQASTLITSWTRLRERYRRVTAESHAECLDAWQENLRRAVDDLDAHDPAWRALLGADGRVPATIQANLRRRLGRLLAAGSARREALAAAFVVIVSTPEELEEALHRHGPLSREAAKRYRQATQRRPMPPTPVRPEDRARTQVPQPAASLTRGRWVPVADRHTTALRETYYHSRGPLALAGPQLAYDQCDVLLRAWPLYRATYVTGQVVAGDQRQRLEAWRWVVKRAIAALDRDEPRWRREVVTADGLVPDRVQDLIRHQTVHLLRRGWATVNGVAARLVLLTSTPEEIEWALGGAFPGGLVSS